MTAGNLRHGMRECYFSRRRVVTLLTVIGLAGCSPKKAQQPQAPPPVVLVAPVVQEDVPIFHEYVGSLEGSVSADIQARVSGYLISQNYKEGTELKKGDLLFQIDPRPFEAALTKARAALAQAAASQRQAELLAQRSVELFQRGVTSTQERDNAVQTNLARKADVDSQAALVKQAELDLEFTRITAPIDGIAGIARAQVGDLVGPSSGILTTISTVDPMKAYFTISEQRYVEYMKRYFDPAQRAQHEKELLFKLILVDGSAYPQNGQLYAMDRQVDPRTGALRIAALFANPAKLLRPGQFARVQVQTEVKKGALLVPQRAVAEMQGTYQVFVVNAESQASARMIKPGARIDSMWIVEEGLKPGESVVVEGVAKMRDGMKIATKPWVAPTPSPQTAAPPSMQPPTGTAARQ